MFSHRSRIKTVSAVAVEFQAVNQFQKGRRQENYLYTDWALKIHFSMRGFVVPKDSLEAPETPDCLKPFLRLNK